MKYTPYTEAQIQSMGLIDEGIYSFEVLEVSVIDRNGTTMRDKNGNDMAKLKLLVWDKDNRERIVYTFITSDSNFAYKLRHYAQTIGMIAAYEDNILEIERTVGKSGKANIVIKKGNLKTDGSGEMWPDRNDVKDFVFEGSRLSPGISPSGIAPFSVDTNENALDDDIPF